MMNKLLNRFILFFLIFPLIADAQTWGLKNGVPNNNGHHHPVTWTLDGFGYAVTGTTRSQKSTKDFYRYAPDSGIWEQLTPFPGTARSFSIGAVYQGMGYLGFGSKGNNTLLNDLWRYNPQSQSWTQLTSCPCAGRQHPAFVVNDYYGKIFVGLGNDTQNLKDWWSYDISSDTWTRKSDFPSTARHHPVEFSFNEYVYVGLGDDDDTNNANEQFFRYDPSNDSWTQVASAPDGIGRIASAQFTYNGFGFIEDGDGAHHKGTNPSIFWRYDPVHDQWATLVPHPGNSLFAPGAFVINDTAYFIGGADRSYSPPHFFDSMWVVPLESLIPTKINPEQKDEFSFKIYPNPVKNTLIIDNSNQQLNSCVISVFNVLGQKKFSQKLNINQKHRLDVSDLPTGVYFLEIKDTKGKSQVFKFLKT